MELGVSAIVPRRRWWGAELFNWSWGLGRGRRVDLLVVDVPVIISDKIQQSPRSSSSTLCWTFQLCRSDVYPQFKLCRRPARSPTGTVLGQVRLARTTKMNSTSESAAGVSFTVQNDTEMFTGRSFEERRSFST